VLTRSFLINYLALFYVYRIFEKVPDIEG